MDPTCNGTTCTLTDRPPRIDWQASVKAIRRGLGISMEAWGRRLEISAMTISRWERGRTTPHLMMQAALRGEATRAGVELIPA